MYYFLLLDTYRPNKVVSLLWNGRSLTVMPKTHIMNLGVEPCTLVLAAVSRSCSQLIHTG